MKDLPWFVLFAAMSAGSGCFIASRYRTASPVQRRQIVIAAAAAVGVALALVLWAALR